MSQYFNINMLDDYLELGLKFKVYVNGEYLVVNEHWDLLNDFKAVGYDFDGAPVEFSYRRSSSYPFDLMRLLALTKPEARPC